jgi:hypothetical protein
MAISDGEWDSIRELVNRMFSTRADPFVTGRVTKVDANNKNIYMGEFGQQPIPMVANDFEIWYYDTLPNGRTVKKKAKASLVMPGKGNTVVVARELGTHRLPRCLGKLVGKRWILTGADE